MHCFTFAIVMSGFFWRGSVLLFDVQVKNAKNEYSSKFNMMAGLSGAVLTVISLSVATAADQVIVNQKLL